VDGSEIGASGPRSATTIEDELARLDQSLVDLSVCGAASVSLVHCPSAGRERSLVRQLSERARKRRFVTAEVSLEAHSPDSPEDLVREILDGLVPPDDRRPRGLLWMLDSYAERHGSASERRFAEAIENEGAEGDLTVLSAAYVAATDPGASREYRAFEAWIDGVEPARRNRNPDVRRPLSDRNAQRTLGELSRIARALGYRGLVIFLSRGDAIAARTERQREKAYTVLRELVDNFDTGNGAIATRVIITGTDAFFEGDHSIRSLAPLLMRLSIPSDAEPPPPHRSWTSLIREPYEYRHRRIAPPPENKSAAMRTIIRTAQGLPPVETVASMSVGHDKIERTIERLFHHTDMAGSVFTVLVGEYGSGKTHLLMHLAERALDENRPVFWLNLERMNLDLGNPARHLSRLLEHSVIPVRRRPSALERASVWTRSPEKVRSLLAALEEIAEGDSEEAAGAKKALRAAQDASDTGQSPGTALETFLSGHDIEDKNGGSYRRDAYRRVLLWVELLRRLDGCRGAVILIDEAENLYSSGLSWSLRRTALRSLSFYCGGAIPGAAVVMAMTPPAFAELDGEAKRLLGEADEMASTLDIEDVALFRRRLSQLTPETVPQLTRKQREELADKVRRTHKSVRGPVDIPDWQNHRGRLSREHRSPRTLIRTLVDELESAWWSGA
jgi:hypothetical protein